MTTSDIAGLCERLDILHAWLSITHERETITTTKDTLEHQAAEIERLRGALLNIQIEAEREDGRWVHLKRVIAINARAALTGEDAGGKG
jgi:hypothetical protein